MNKITLPNIQNVIQNSVQIARNTIQNTVSKIHWLDNRFTVHAIYDEDIDNLKRHFLVDKTTMEHCRHCNAQITPDNLGGWIKIDGRLVPFCDLIECFPLNRD